MFSVTTVCNDKGENLTAFQQLLSRTSVLCSSLYIFATIFIAIVIALNMDFFLRMYTTDTGIKNNVMYQYSNIFGK